MRLKNTSSGRMVVSYILCICSFIHIVHYFSTFLLIWSGLFCCKTLLCCSKRLIYQAICSFFTQMKSINNMQTLVDVLCLSGHLQAFGCKICRHLNCEMFHFQVQCIFLDFLDGGTGIEKQLSNHKVIYYTRELNTFFFLLLMNWSNNGWAILFT